jgi:DNA-binding GntR family transcriptional regulator
MTSALRVVSMVDAVADALRKAIFSGEFAPGVPLTEALLSTKFEVPRPTVRSAVQMVMQDGLLRREPNRSVYVPVLTAEDIRDVFSVRRVLEVDAVDKLVTRDLTPTAALRAQHLLESLDDSDGWDDVVRYDFELHQALIDTIGSPRMSKIYSSISAEIRLVLTQLRPVVSPAQIAAEHRVLIDAILSKDVQVATDATREHLDASERVLLEQFSNPHQEESSNA